MLRSARQIAAAFVALASETPEGELESLAKRFVRSLGRHRKILPAVVAAAQRLVDAQEGRTRLRVTTAFPVDDAAFRDIVGAKTIVSSRVDSEVIGGAIIEEGDTRIDGSIRAALKELHRTLSREPSL